MSTSDRPVKLHIRAVHATDDGEPRAVGALCGRREVAYAPSPDRVSCLKCLHALAISRQKEVIREAEVQRRSLASFEDVINGTR